MRSINKFLLISLCLLCWHSSCDTTINDDGDGMPRKGPDPETEVFQERLFIPIVESQQIELPPENVNIQLPDTVNIDQSEDAKEDVNIIEKKKLLAHPDVKVSKFSETIRKMRRKDIPIGPLNKRKITPSISSTIEVVKINPEEPDPDVKTDVIVPKEIEEKLSVTPIELPQTHPDLKESPSIIPVPDEIVGSQIASPDALPEDQTAKDVHPSEIVVNVQETPDPGHPHSEAMPSFDEWKKMMLAEQEKGGHRVPSALSPPGKKIASQKRRRNYASYECGAKIVAFNGEAEGTSRILNERVDEYMLNPCKAKIWFVIELCETVQASQIELANFELFSSCPKDFAVSSSDNFPTRDWVNVGVFTAAEQRVLQSFQLKSEGGFSKFIKVEFVSHYGKEHYCPLNVVRVFGTSMVDEYEELEKMSADHSIPDDELDRLDLQVEDKSSSNLFGSATDAVYNIVKKAAQVLGQHQSIDESSEKGIEQNISEADHCKLIDDSCSVGRKNVTESDISDIPRASSVLSQSLYHHLRHCDQCVTASRHSYYSVALPQCRFFQAAFGPVIYKSICDWFKDHLLVTLEKVSIVDVKQNHSGISPKPPSPPPSVINVIIDKEPSTQARPSYNDISSALLPSEGSPPQETGQLPPTTKIVENIITVPDKEHKPIIQPTKTFQSTDGELRVDLSGTLKNELQPDSEFLEAVVNPILDEDKLLPSSEKVPPKVFDTFTPAVTIPVDHEAPSVLINTTKKTDTEEKMDNFYDENLVLELETAGVDSSTVEPGTREFTVDMKTGEIKESASRIDPVVVGSATFSASQKESVFVRMNNRIKALELNMSLSSQYLQELSQRYRRQMEEMQRAFNRTIGTLNDTAKKAVERDLKQQEVIGNLQSQLSNLTTAVDQMFEIHIFLMITEVIVMTTIMSLCVRRISSTIPLQPQLAVQGDAVHEDVVHGNEVQGDAVRPSRSDMKRRNSAGSCSPPSTKRVKKRSSSDEALASDELLIVEPFELIIVEPPPRIKKKHRKKKQLQRSLSNPSMSPRKKSSATSLKTSKGQDRTCSAGLLFCNKSSTSSSGSTDLSFHSCENCDHESAKSCISKRSHSAEKQRTNSIPLKNLTNGGEVVEQYSTNSSANRRDKFNLRKYLNFQKRESI